MKRASAMIYVSNTGDLGADEAMKEFRKCDYWRDIVELVVRDCLQAKLTNTAPKLRKDLPKLLFVFNSDRVQWQCKFVDCDDFRDVDTHSFGYTQQEP